MSLRRIAFISVLEFILFFPGISLFLQFPMFGGGTTTPFHDPNTSQWVFIPSYRNIKWEFFENLNLL
jgi:hypothetical protein